MLEDPAAPPSTIPMAENESTDPPPVLTVPEAAAFLRVNVKTVYAEITAGRIQAIRLGRTLRISRAVLEALCAVRK